MNPQTNHVRPAAVYAWRVRVCTCTLLMETRGKASLTGCGHCVLWGAHNPHARWINTFDCRGGWRWMRLKDSLEFNVQKRESWKHGHDSSIIQVGNNMCFLSNWSSWFIFTSLSKCRAECVRVLVCVSVCVRSVDSTYNLSGGKQGLKNFQGATAAAQWRPPQPRARVISTFKCISADVLMSRESMGNGDELQKHWYKALFQCDKHHYWRLQTYTCTDCHALAYMTDTLYIVLCYLHSFKEATTQLAQPRLSPRCLPLRHAVCRDATACWGLKVQWWPVYALRWCKSASGEKKKQEATEFALESHESPANT